MAISYRGKRRRRTAMEKDPRQQQTQPKQQPKPTTDGTAVELSDAQLDQLAGGRMGDPCDGGE
jgi:hypothetical protein